jgi:hypothetical protein
MESGARIREQTQKDSRGSRKKRHWRHATQPPAKLSHERCENKRANAEGQQRIEEEETLETRQSAPQLSCPFAAPSGPLMGQFRRSILHGDHCHTTNNRERGKGIETESIRKNWYKNKPVR